MYITIVCLNIETPSRAFDEINPNRDTSKYAKG